MPVFIAHAALDPGSLGVRSGPSLFFLREGHSPEPVKGLDGYPLRVSPLGGSVAISSTQGLAVLSRLTDDWSSYDIFRLSASATDVHWLGESHIFVETKLRRVTDVRLRGEVLSKSLQPFGELEIPEECIGLWAHDGGVNACISSGEAWAVIERPLEKAGAWRPRLSGSDEAASCVASADGRFLALAVKNETGEDGWDVLVVDLNDQSRQRIADHADPDMIWMRDCRTLAFEPTDASGIRMVDVAGNRKDIPFPEIDMNPSLGCPTISASTDSDHLTCDPIWLGNAAYCYSVADRQWRPIGLPGTPGFLLVRGL